ncbi:MAG: ABC transporter ATP-binding protein [Rhodobacteraceae bacterium]|nr:ABC transporter ATP-binding protein [Paracoccaceae bacterium]
MNAGPKICFDAVSLSRGERVILGPVSLTLLERRIGVVGRNGSGKSTFARLLAGLLKPDSGTVTLDATDVWSDRKAAVDRIGVIFQNPDHQIIFPTVQEEIAFGLQQQGLSKAAASKAAMAVLEQQLRADWASRNCHTLSQGQRHYLCLMAVLAMEPDVVVLDEPYAGLDIPTSMQLHDALDELDQSLVLITHDTDVLAGFDRVIWIDDGKIRQDGAAESVLPAYVTAMKELGQGGC